MIEQYLQELVQRASDTNLKGEALHRLWPSMFAEMVRDSVLEMRDRAAFGQASLSKLSETKWRGPKSSTSHVILPVASRAQSDLPDTNLETLRNSRKKGLDLNVAFYRQHTLILQCVALWHIRGRTQSVSDCSQSGAPSLQICERPLFTISVIS